MISQFHYIFPFGKENAEVVYDFHSLVSLTDYGTFENDEYYEDEHHLFATIYKNHDPENNIDVFILYLSVEHRETLNPADIPGNKTLTLVFDTLDECTKFLVPYLFDTKETLDFITTYHEVFHGKDNCKD